MTSDDIFLGSVSLPLSDYLPLHSPNDALDGVVEKEISFSGKIKKVDQESEVYQDDLHLLTAAFRDSHLCMQA